jgi:hypothetical protein
MLHDTVLRISPVFEPIIAALIDWLAHWAPDRGWVSTATDRAFLLRHTAATDVVTDRASTEQHHVAQQYTAGVHCTMYLFATKHQPGVCMHVEQ